MKKAIKIIGIVLGTGLLLLAVGALIIHLNGIPHFEVEAPEVNVELDSARLARGAQLAAMICADCHRGQNGKLDGRELTDMPAVFGEIRSANITNDPTYGIGRYTDGELIYLLRTGIKRDGQYVPPYMPKFPHMSDEDLHSVIAYLRSDARPVQASTRAMAPSRPSFLTKLLSYLAFRPLPFPREEIVAPPKTDQVAYGRYLAVGAVECYGCHSEDFKSFNALEPEKTPGFLGGGNHLMDMDGNTVRSANLTMHPEYGIGKWTREQFRQAVRFGQRPDGTTLSDAMPRFSAMNEEEVDAIWAWLQTVPVQPNQIARSGR